MPDRHTPTGRMQDRHTPIGSTPGLHTRSGRLPSRHPREVWAKGTAPISQPPTARISAWRSRRTRQARVPPSPQSARRRSPSRIPRRSHGRRRPGRSPPRAQLPLHRRSRRSRQARVPQNLQSVLHRSPSRTPNRSRSRRQTGETPPRPQTGPHRRNRRRLGRRARTRWVVRRAGPRVRRGCPARSSSGQMPMKRRLRFRGVGRRGRLIRPRTTRSLHVHRGRRRSATRGNRIGPLPAPTLLRVLDGRVQGTGRLRNPRHQRQTGGLRRMRDGCRKDRPSQLARSGWRGC